MCRSLYRGDDVITYKPLYRLMQDRQMKWEDLREGVGMSSATSAKLHRGEPVSLGTVDRLCAYFQCKVEDVLEYED